jgi:hypothetical protein
MEPDSEHDLHTSASISSLCRECADSYGRLCVALRDSKAEEAVENGFDRDSSLVTVQDARARFKAWAVNIAALHEEHLRSSLDFRLKEATEIRQRIVKILQNLHESLEDGEQHFELS